MAPRGPGRQGGGLGGEAAAASGEAAPRLGPELSASAHGAPILPFPSSRGTHPNLRPQGDLDARAKSEGDLGSAPTSKSQTRSQPEACGEAAAGPSERSARKSRPEGIPQTGAEPLHPAALEQWAEGLRAQRRSQRSPSTPALEAPPLGRLPDCAGRAAPPAPAPSRSAPGGAGARALPPRRCSRSC